jgi:hypothetical protein
MELLGTQLWHVQPQLARYVSLLSFFSSPSTHITVMLSRHLVCHRDRDGSVDQGCLSRASLPIAPCCSLAPRLLLALRQEKHLFVWMWRSVRVRSIAPLWRCASSVPTHTSHVLPVRQFQVVELVAHAPVTLSVQPHSHDEHSATSLTTTKIHVTHPPSAAHTVTHEDAGDTARFCVGSSGLHGADTLAISMEVPVSAGIHSLSTTQA